MKKLTLISSIIVISFLIAASANATPVKWIGNNHWYEAIYSPDGANWQSALAGATARGGSLASVASDAENNFIFNLINDSKYWFTDDYGNAEGPRLGGYQYDGLAEPSGHWAWINGDPWSYTNWNPGEPNNFGGFEHTVVFFNPGTPLPGSTWNDVSFGTPSRGYIIEWETNPIPLPNAFWLLGSGLLGLAGWRRFRKI